MPLILAIVVHEWAHARMALQMGDPTAYAQGRCSINPIKHVDPVGTIVLPLATWAAIGVPLGWAKPVPVDPNLLEDDGFVYVMAAGIGANIAMAALWALAGLVPLEWVATMSSYGWKVNLALAAINALPIKPLDGYYVVQGSLKWMGR